MPRANGLKVQIAGVDVPLIPGNAKLTPVRGYYKRRRGNLYFCDIRKPPENVWERAIEYAEYLRGQYGKTVKLAVVAIGNQRYLRWEREDGVPVFISQSGEIYTSARIKRKYPEKLNVTVRFLAESCGYKIAEKKISPWW